MLPMQDPALALKELERAAKCRMRGLYLATNVNNVELDEKRFWDIYGNARSSAGRSTFTRWTRSVRTARRGTT